MNNQKISIIVAIDRKRGIGKNNKLPWYIPEDLKRFREITSGHSIIMGRKTFASIGKVLPNRINIVITRDKNYKQKGVIVRHSLEDAIELAKKKENREIFIIGGGQIFEQAIGVADKLYLTIVEARITKASARFKSEAGGKSRRGSFGCDTFFPKYSDFKKILFEKSFESGGFKGKFLELER